MEGFSYSLHSFLCKLKANKKIVKRLVVVDVKELLHNQKFIRRQNFYLESSAFRFQPTVEELCESDADIT